MVTTVDPIIVVLERDESTVEVIGSLVPRIIEAATVGPAGPQNLFVQETNPNMTSPGLWVQTFPNGDLSFWVENGL